MASLIRTDDFELKIQSRLYESDNLYPISHIINICVASSDFSAKTTMNVYIKDIIEFVVDLKKLYIAVNGCARLEDNVVVQNYFELTGKGDGYISVKGCLYNSSLNGFEQELKFENIINQIYLKPFIDGLNTWLQKFLHHK